MPLSQRTKRYTVLYVDDESENLTGFKFLFRRYYRVLLATSGEQALEMLEQEPTQLVLADQRMPKMTGASLLSKIAQAYPDITRIIVTGYSDIEGIIEAVNKGGIYYYVTKPWNAEELRMIIDRALEAYQLRNDKKELIDDLRSSNAELDTFLYRAAHHLRRPVTPWLGLFTGATLCLGHQDALELFHKIEETALGMGTLLRKLYMINDLTPDGEEEDPQPIALESMVEEVWEELRYLLADAEANLDIHLDASITGFQSYPILLRNILFNLLENALVFTREERDSYVTVRAFREEAKLWIEVSDNGIGIPEEYQGKVFNMYAVATERTDGSGLGLYVVKRSTEVLGGAVTLESEEGRGTTVRLWTPFTPISLLPK